MHFEDNPLSEREKEVAKVLLLGKSNKQIALQLGISTRTVEFHLRNIYTKLGATSRTEAVLKLAGSHLWETPGQEVSDPLGKATVDEDDDSTENEPPPILRRVSMKTTFFIIGGLLTILVMAILVLVNLPAVEGLPPATAISSAHSSAVPTDLSTPALPTPTEIVQPEKVVIPSHTVNGYTAAIESYYIDTANVLFQVRITGEAIAFGDQDYYGRVRVIDLYDEYGNIINSSGGAGPALDPALIQLEFHPVTHFVGARLKGQFAFDLNKTSAWEETLAQFRFDFDLPIDEPKIFRPRQTVSANGLEILLDQVTVTPNFAQVYLCFPSPSFADWQMGSQSILQIEGQEAVPYYFTVAFDSALGGDRRAGSEPYWAPLIKEGRCVKSGFPLGSSNPASLTLTIPQLEKTDPNVLLTDQLVRDYPGLTPKEAYYKYLEEHGNIYKGPWTFTVVLSQ